MLRFLNRLFAGQFDFDQFAFRDREFADGLFRKHDIAVVHFDLEEFAACDVSQVIQQPIIWQTSVTLPFTWTIFPT